MFLKANLTFYSRAMLFSLVIIFSCSPNNRLKNSAALSKEPGSPAVQQVQREFRAAWVATVANINWPSKPGLSTAQQQQEAINLLDFLQQHNFNAVIFQVRPQADALYKSALEPWSYYLTGKQGKAPEPFYDPLEFWTKAAHDRGLELHVWLNPYRAHHVAGGEIGENSVVKTKPNLVVKLEEGYWWFDPSLKETQDHGVNVVMDIVKRYDIDGVHFDDYFYPYPSYNKNKDFPDSSSWKAYQLGGGQLSRGDWRRASVNNFISRIYTEIKKEKQHVKFGLSPFGIWRPGHPAGIEGMDQYNELYADAKLWLNKGWVDYFAPQLYWPINRLTQSYPVLLGWWNQENAMQRHLWPGINVGRDTSAKNTGEIVNEIMISRGMLPQSPGVIHWSISQVTQNPPMAKALLDGPYKKPALVPASPWLDKIPPAAPTASLRQDSSAVSIGWKAADDKDVFKWVVYFQYGNRKDYKLLPGKDRLLVLPLQQGRNRLNSVSVAAVDRLGNESIAAQTTTDQVLIQPRSSWNAAPPRPYKQHVPVRITVHHEGGKVLADTASATTRLKNVQTWCMGPDRKWTDIPYHYLIAPDGTVYEGRNPLTVGETNTEYDPTGHLLICFLGNYNEQSLNPNLLNVMNRLIAHFCKQYDISPDNIATHRDYSKNTTCPGTNIYPYFQSGETKKAVRKILNKNN